MAANEKAARTEKEIVLRELWQWNWPRTNPFILSYLPAAATGRNVSARRRVDCLYTYDMIKKKKNGKKERERKKILSDAGTRLLPRDGDTHSTPPRLLPRFSRLPLFADSQRRFWLNVTIENISETVAVEKWKISRRIVGESIIFREMSQQTFDRLCDFIVLQ